MSRSPPATRKAIRHEYEDRGVEGFYRDRGRDYRNPHEPQIRKSIGIAAREWKPDLSRVLDLAAGSGEATLALRTCGAGAIDGIDPFTYEAYHRRTGKTARQMTFEDVAAGKLSGSSYSLIVCSFALHLVEPSRLPQLCYQLSEVSENLLVITPHKRPMIRESWGWELQEEMVVQRIRLRLYSRSVR
jgi:SAM-dependent methyltransferase